MNVINFLPKILLFTILIKKICGNDKILPEIILPLTHN